jgi:fatty acid desaturase
VALLPSIIATSRRHRSRLAIEVLNVLTIVIAVGGVLFFGVGLVIGVPLWFVALIWSCTGNVEPRSMAVALGARAGARATQA